MNIVILLLLGSLIVLSQGSAVESFIYTVLTGSESNDTFEGFNFHREESTISTLATCEQ